MVKRIGIEPALLSLLLAGCVPEAEAVGDMPPAPPLALAPAARCLPPLQEVPVVELFFGRGLPGGGEVTEEAWRRFLDDEVTPRFPDGLTVFDAYGQWRSNGVVEREHSKVLLVLAVGVADRDARLATIMDAYGQRFRQRSVLRIDTVGCYLFRESVG